MSTAAIHDDAFSAHAGGLARSIGRTIGPRRPWFAALIVWVVAFLLLGAVIIGLGLLLTHVLLPAGLARQDASWDRWFVTARTPSLNEVTRFGSDLGSSTVILAVSAITGVVLALRRHWRQFAFLAFALTLEFSLFILTTIIISRHRPTVPQLDGAPPTSSFPSGHTASALTLYVGLAIVLSTLVRSTLQRTLVWLVAVLLPDRRGGLTPLPRHALSDGCGGERAARHRRAAVRAARGAKHGGGRSRSDERGAPADNHSEDDESEELAA